MARCARRAVSMIAVLTAAALCSAISAGDWYADPTHVRKGRWDFQAFAGWTESNTLDRSTGGSKDTLELEGIPLGGVRAEAHFHDNFAFAMSFAGTRPDYDFTSNAGGVKTTVSDDVVLTWIDADLTWRITDWRSTPYVVGGIGAFNIADDRVGNTFFAEQHFEYHAAIGWEWWLGEHLLINAQIRGSVTELELWPDNLVFVEGVVGVGYRSAPPRKRLQDYNPTGY